MAQKSFQCRLITPTAKVLDEAVTYASIPAWDGLMGFLPGRAPIVAKLGVGELRLDFPDAGSAKGGSRSYLVEDGFVQMVEDRLTILAGKAVPVESLNAAEAQAELDATLARAKAAASAPAAERPVQQDKARREQTFARAKVRLARGAGKGI